MHARFIARVAAAALALSVGATPAAARQATEIDSAKLPGWSFVPAFALGVVHDSNVALTSPRADVGETEGDRLFNIVPSGQLRFVGKHTDFSAGYSGFLRRYANVEGLDGFNQRANIGFTHAASRRLSMFARNTFADSPTTDETEVNGVPFQRTGSRTNNLASGADYRLSKLTTLATRYDMMWVNFDRDEEISTLTGGWVHGIRAELAHQLNARLTAGGEYSYRTASLNQGDRELGFQDAGGVIRYAIGPHTSANASAGFALLHDRTASQTRTGPYVRMSVTHEVEFATLSGGYERQYVPSFGFGGANSSQELFGRVRVPIGRHRMYLVGSSAWRRSVPFEADALELDTVWIRSTFGYAVARWARMEALYTYTRQDSIITGGEVNRHRVGIQFVVSQPMRIH